MCIMDIKLIGVSVDSIISLGKVLENEYRRKILSLCKEKSLSISAIQRDIGLTYSVLHKHITILKNSGLINTERQLKSSGNAVLVRSKVFVSEKGTLEKTNKV